MPFAATWMELETLILSELSQKEKKIPYDITYIWNLIYGTNESFHRNEKHGHGEETYGCQGGGGGIGMDWEFGVNRCKLLPLEWISNEILMIALGTISSHLWWKKIIEKKECTYACVSEPPCYTVEN